MKIYIEHLPYSLASHLYTLLYSMPYIIIATIESR